MLDIEDPPIVEIQLVIFHGAAIRFGQQGV